MNRGDLKASIASYTKRTDIADADLNNFVDLATARIGRDLMSSYNENYETVTVSADPAPLPARCRRLRAIDHHADGGPRPLRSMGVQQIERLSQSGLPVGYCPRGRVVQIKPHQNGDYQFNYFQDPEALTSDTSENAVLTAYPNLYLYACLVEAYLFIRDANAANGTLVIYETELATINKAEKRLRAGATPAAGLG